MSLVVILLAAGALLLFLETFLPGGVAGVAGLICLGVAVGMGYRTFGPRGGTLVLGVVVAGGIVGSWAWLRFFPESRAAARFISRSAVGDLGVDHAGLLHATGEAISPLRPSGMALIGGRRVDVVAESAMIPAGTAVRVVAVEGSRVVVRAAG